MTSSRILYAVLPLMGGALLAAQAPINARLRTALDSPFGSAVVSFTTGMPLAGKLEHLMLFFILPALLVYLLFSTLRAWRRQH